MSKDYGTISKQIKSFRAKEKLLDENFSRVAPMEFYRDIFAKGTLQEYNKNSNNESSDDETPDGKGCGIFRFAPDINTFKKMKAQLEKKCFDDFYRDADEMQKLMAEFGDPRFSANLDLQLDVLERKFHAGKYYKPGTTVGLTYIDKRTGKEKEAKFDQRVHDDLRELGEAMGKRFAYMAPISYWGKKANSKNAHMLYALVIDLDGVGVNQLKSVIGGIVKDDFYMCAPTYIVNSGHGLHLYYVLEEPIPCYHYVRPIISKLKNNMAYYIWNKRTSTITNHIDDQPWAQMYRVVGSATKLGADCITTAYKTGGYVTLEKINEYLYDDKKIQLPLESYKPSGVSGKPLEYWKEKNPEWYKRKILGEYDPKAVKGSFPWLYEKFLNRVHHEAKVGSRYHCMCVLFADAALGGIPFDEAYKAAVHEIDFLNRDVEEGDEKNLFTQNDVDCATKYYNTEFGNWMTLERVESMTGFRYERNKRNHNTQADHLKMARYMRDEVRGKKDTWRNTDGRPKGSKDSYKRHRIADSSEQTVRSYLLDHPEAKKAEVIRGTGLSKPTVYKWYDKIKSENVQ